MKTIIAIATFCFASCAEFNPTPEQINAVAELAKVIHATNAIHATK